MSDRSDYWTRKALSRRAALRSAALAGGGLVALSLAGCGGDDDADEGASGEKPKETIDPTKGVRGGKLVVQQFSDPGGGLELVKVRNFGVHQMAGFTHDGLLEFRNGTPAYDGYDLGQQPALAQAMPEQLPDKLSYVFKLRPAKFHNGQTVTSQDVKYSFERFAGGADSAWKNDWTWFDRVETPDQQTAIVKTKAPYADSLISLAQRGAAEVLSQAWEESPEHEKKLMGTGAFLFVEYTPPVGIRYKRNPEYHRQPYPYFEELHMLGTSDVEKKVADFLSRQTHMTYWFNAEQRERIKKGRPDAQLWTYDTGGSTIHFRTDRPPFNDERVRQGLSMGYDRQKLIEATVFGEGEPDQGVLTWTGKFWRFRKPKDLGPNSKYWNYDVQAAKQLLAAAGHTQPIEVDMLHWNSTVIGQGFVDQAILIQTHWRQNGLVNSKDTELTFGQGVQTYGTGNYEGLYYAPNVGGYVPDMGLALRNQFFSPPDGVKGPPTVNTGYVNDQDLSAKVVKQLEIFDVEERINYLRGIEDIFAVKHYRMGNHSGKTNYFGDQNVVNMQTARDAYNGGVTYVKYWWHKDGKTP